MALLVSAFNLWMIVDAAMNPRLRGADKVVWVLICILLGPVGALLYFLWQRNRY
jgi:hypothetical protein